MNTIVNFVGKRLARVGHFRGHCANLAIGQPSWSQLLWPACQQGLLGHLFTALGVASDARQMSQAIGKSVRSGDVRPAAAQATRSLTTWGAVWAGAELFGTGGALLGLETGPGAAVTSGVGAVMGGFVGLFASEWLARKINLSN